LGKVHQNIGTISLSLYFPPSAARDTGALALSTGLVYWASWELSRHLLLKQLSSPPHYFFEGPLSNWSRPEPAWWGPRWPGLLDLGRSLVQCFAGLLELLVGALLGLVRWLLEFIHRQRLLRAGRPLQQVPLALGDMAAALPIGGAGLAAVAGAPAGGIAQNSFCMIPSDDQT